MRSHCLTLILFLLFPIALAQEECGKDALSFSKCPGKCIPKVLLGDTVSDCSALSQFGCTLERCSEDGLACVQGKLPPQVLACPGQPLIFNSASVRSTIDISLGLNAMPLETDPTISMLRPIKAVHNSRDQFAILLKMFEGVLDLVWDSSVRVALRICNRLLQM